MRLASIVTPRRAALGAALLLALPPLLPSAAAQQQDFSKVQITTTPVAGAVSMLEGQGGNIGVSAGEDGILIVDDQFEPLAEKIRAALDKLGTGGPRFLVNTHWHGDHTGGNKVFGQQASIVAQDNVRARLMHPNEVMGRTPDPAPAVALPRITFADSVTLHWNGEDVAVIHFPHGHTDGDSVVAFTRSKVIHLGDHFFTGRFPFIDLGSGGDVQGYTRNVAAMLAAIPADWKVIPGHGPLAGRDELAAFHDMLVKVTDIVRERLAAGQSAEQVAAAGLPDEWASWGSGFMKTDRWLTIVAQSLQAAPDGPDPAASEAAGRELAAAIAAGAAGGVQPAPAGSGR
jgi:glyoxylase-like metal-dependent hydrolase (beta-lactamase superfamily II)